MQIPQDTIETIRDRVDITDTVSRYVELRRTGSNLKGLCPFHQEKTPSFVVSPEKQIFHCFGCGKGGNVFVFLMEMEGVSFPEAVRTLGRQCGVEVENRSDSTEERSKNEAYYRANAFAARFYHKLLKEGRAGARARAYLEKRGIAEQAWKSFSLGYAPDSWDQLWSAARRERIPQDVLAELKLIVKSEKSKGYYDYFRNRIIFPILSVSNRVIAFGARAIADGAEPKYLNSTESAVFAKRRVLYGIDRARDAIRKRREVILVEGYTDLITLHLLGLEHTVAACGTAFTPDHASTLRRLAPKATLVPDADDAGEKAAVTAGAILLASGLEVRVAVLPPGGDPDGIARELGVKKFEVILDGAMDYFNYLDYIIKGRQLSVREQETITRHVLSGLAHLEDKLRYDVIVKELAQILGVDAASLRAAGAGSARRQFGASEAVSAQPSGGADRTSQARTVLEKMALRLIMEGTPIASDAVDSLDADDFSDPNCREVYKALDSALESHIDISSREFQRRVEAAGLAGLAAEIALTSIPPGNVATLLKDAVRRIKELKIRDELTVLRGKLQELPSESEEAVAVAEYYHKLKQALVEL